MCVVLLLSHLIVIKACWVILFKADSVYQFPKDIYSVMSEVYAHKITKENKRHCNKSQAIISEFIIDLPLLYIKPT